MTGPRIYPDNTAVSRTPRATPGLLDLLRSVLQKGQEGAEAWEQRIASGLPEGTLGGTIPAWIGGPGGAPKIVGKVGEGLKKMLGISGKRPLGREGIDVFHASPVRGINKFGLEYVGTGQGAQAQGHGLYFAELDKVAKNYLPVDGGLYKASLDVTPEQLLDWDKMISAQSDYVKRALGKVHDPVDPFEMAEAQAKYDAIRALKGYKENGLDRLVADNMYRRITAQRTGEDAYWNILRNIRDGVGIDQGAAASKALKDAGIPGIRYRDALSRLNTTGDVTSNYVIFDPERIRILKMLGLAGVGAFGAKKANDAR